MSGFVELDEEVILEVLEQYKDKDGNLPNDLDKEAEKMDAFYRQFVCHQCSNPKLQKRFHPGKSTFVSGDLLGRASLYCPNCNYEFSPFSGLTINAGDITKAVAIPSVEEIESGRRTR